MGARFDLTGKIALVTGGSKGIGEAMARAVAAQGASVVVSSRDQNMVDTVAASIRDAGGKAVGIAAHVGREDQLEALVEKTTEAFGGLDILINNAAANPVYGPVHECGDDAFDKIMNVNVKAPFTLSKLALPLMKQRGGGSIINISSIGGVSPEPGLGIYSVSKAALVSLTKVCAKEWGSLGIRVNVICPGLIKTKFSEALWRDEKVLQRFERGLPLGRIGEPEDMMGIAVFLASDASLYSTGGVYMTDGGYTI